MVKGCGVRWPGGRPWFLMLEGFLAGYNGLNPSREEVAAAIYVRTVHEVELALAGEPRALRKVRARLRGREVKSK